MTTIDRRQHFRIVYPLRARPTLVVSNREFQVTDVSETGLRFWAIDAHLFVAGDEVDGTLRLPLKRGVFHIHGHVVRHERSGAVAIVLDRYCELPFSLMLSEQRSLIQLGMLKTG
jgi:hypothetical protein